MALVRCILGKFLGEVCHCFPPRSEVPTFAATASTSATTREILAAKGGTMGLLFCLQGVTINTIRDLSHAVNLRHGTSKGRRVENFFALKNPSLNPRTWVLKASTLPLDHRSHWCIIYLTFCRQHTTTKFNRKLYDNFFSNLI